MNSSISTLVVYIFIFLLVSIVLTKLLKKSGTTLTNYPYQKTFLFSPGELSFLRVLYQTVGNSAKVFGKVKVADVIVPKRRLLPSYRQTAFNKISRKHFDFLLCNNDDFSVICAIELNDKSHLSDKRKQRDNFLNEACNAAGLPLIQITAKRNYIINDIKEQLSPYLYLN